MNQVLQAFIDDNLTVVNGVPRIWFVLPPNPYDLSSEDDLEGFNIVRANLFESLPEGVHQLLVVAKPLSLEKWAEKVNGLVDLKHGEPANIKARQELWVQITEEYRSFLARSGETYRRVTFLGADPGSASALEGLRKVGEAVKDWLRRTERAVGVVDPRPSPVTLERLRSLSHARAVELAEILEGTRPATASELRWLIARHGWRQMAGKPWTGAAGPAWGGVVEDLMGCELEGSRHCVHIDRPEGEAWVATLPFHRIPRWLYSPIAGGNEWLQTYLSLGFPVDVCAHIEVISTERAAAMLQRKVVNAGGQMDEAAEVGVVHDPKADDAYVTARQLRSELQHDQKPLLRSHVRLLVSGSTRQELEDRVRRLRAHYRKLEIHLSRPTHGQRDLFIEALPGAPLMDRSWGQEQKTITLGGSMFGASTELGDQWGPFIGWTLGLMDSPAFHDPLLPGRYRETPLTAIIGRSGSGKSNLAYLLAWFARLMGAAGLLVDPKSESIGLQGLPGVGPVTRIRFDRPGLLDPYLIVPVAQAKSLVLDLIRQLIGGDLSDDVRLAIYNAVQKAHSQGWWHMHGVLYALAEQAEESDAARLVYLQLRETAESPLGSVLFGNGTQRPVNLVAGLTVLQFEGLDLPRAHVPRNDWNDHQRLSSVLMQAVGHLAAAMLTAGDRDLPKAVFFDEAWMVTGSSQGKAILDRFARLGSAMNVSTHLISQNADDFLDEGLRNQFSPVFALQVGSRGEAERVMRLLGLPATEANMSRLMVQARPREEGGDEEDEDATARRNRGRGIYRDRAGRVGEFQVDLVDPALVAAFETNANRQSNLEIEATPELREVPA